MTRPAPSLPVPRRKSPLPTPSPPSPTLSASAGSNQSPSSDTAGSIPASATPKITPSQPVAAGSIQASHSRDQTKSFQRHSRVHPSQCHDENNAFPASGSRVHPSQHHLVPDKP